MVTETRFLSRITPVSRTEEKRWFVSLMKGIKTNTVACVIAEHDGVIVGISSIERDDVEVSHHVGRFGVLVLKKYTGLGLGTQLTERTLALGKERLRLELVVLHVYSKNHIAQKLYAKTGFVHAGTIPNAILRKGRYMDDIIMYKKLA